MPRKEVPGDLRKIKREQERNPMPGSRVPRRIPATSSWSPAFDAGRDSEGKKQTSLQQELVKATREMGAKFDKFKIEPAQFGRS